MRYAIKSTDGKYINIITQEGKPDAMFHFDAGHPVWYPARFTAGTFYLEHFLLLAAIHSKLGKPYEALKDFRLVDLNGAVYTLNWRKMKQGQLVMSVPVEDVKHRDYPEAYIPEVWKHEPRVFIDHFAIRVNPFDYFRIRWQDSGHDLSDLQAIILDGIDHGIRRYIGTQDRSLTNPFRKIENVRSDGLDCHHRETLKLIEPLILDEIEKTINTVDVPEAKRRFAIAKKKIMTKVQEQSALPWVRSIKSPF